MHFPPSTNILNIITHLQNIMLNQKKGKSQLNNTFWGHGGLDWWRGLVNVKRQRISCWVQEKIGNNFVVSLQVVCTITIYPWQCRPPIVATRKSLLNQAIVKRNFIIESLGCTAKYWGKLWYLVLNYCCGYVFIV